MKLKLTDTQRSAFDQLGYDENWVRAGVLDQTVARDQLSSFVKPNADKFTEHYRKGALQQFFATKEALSPDEFELLMKIASSELTKGLGEHVFHTLCNFSGLDDSQFEQLIVSHASASFDKLKFRRSLQRQITNGQSIDDIDTAIASGDTQLQSWLVHNEYLDLHQAEKLQEQGGSKAVRHLAKIFVRKLVNSGS